VACARRILGIAVGIATFFFPGIPPRPGLFIGCGQSDGIFEVVAGFELPIERDWLLVIAGIASIIFGVLVFVNPVSGALAITWLNWGLCFVFGCHHARFRHPLARFARQALATHAHDVTNDLNQSRNSNSSSHMSPRSHARSAFAQAVCAAKPSNRAASSGESVSSK